jgi:predicted  nucleic acid-binding Zn-ribbon protein
MAQQSSPQSLGDDMVKMWQAWMRAGLNAMQPQMWAFPPGAKLSDPTAELPHQIEKAVRASLEAAQIPSTADLEQLGQKAEALRTAVEAMRTDLAGVEALVRRQEDKLQALERAIREPSGLRQEIEAAIGTYWEDRMAGVMRSLDELRRGVETLSLGIAGSQTTAKTLEQTTQERLDPSQKPMRGRRGARKKAEGD